MQIGCLAAEIESQVANLTKEVAELEAAFQAERAALAAEREKAHKSVQVLKATTDLVFRRDAELEWEVQARLGAKIELEVARVALAAADMKALEDIAMARAEAAKEVEEEFRDSFF